MDDRLERVEARMDAWEKLILGIKEGLNRQDRRAEYQDGAMRELTLRVDHQERGAGQLHEVMLSLERRLEGLSNATRAQTEALQEMTSAMAEHATLLIERDGKREEQIRSVMAEREKDRWHWTRLLALSLLALAVGVGGLAAAAWSYREAVWKAAHAAYETYHKP